MLRKSALPGFAAVVRDAPRTKHEDVTAPSSPGARRAQSGVARSNETPTRIAKRYLVEKLVGRGGNAEIFEVIDESSGRRLALKLLRPDAADDESAVQLFEREYHTLASLTHPRIIRVYDYGVDGSQFYTMDLVEGRDLRELAPLPYRDACRHLRDIASSLTLLHTRRLLYRDLSPRNARVDAQGSCRLLDFGALIAFGTAKHLVGTPPSVPPEAFYRLPLDQRSDLYALGAVAYFLLSGQHAYPVKQFDELPRAWASPVLPLPAEVPPRLSELVLSMLSLDPIERPAYATEVIDVLTGVGGLEPETDAQVARSYLLSPRLVGRRSELDLLSQRLDDALGGRGAAVWLEGSMGVGKTRLITELQVAARLRGALAVRVDAETQRGSSNVAEGLALALLDVAPGLASATAAPYALALSQLSSQMSQRLGVTPDPSSSAGERRATLQTALSDWLLATAREKPLVALVDNVQWVDPASAALLLTLVAEAPSRSLYVVLTHRSGEIGFEDSTLERLRERCHALPISALRSGDIVALVQSLFGPVPYAHRFAEWLERQVGGNPMFCLELARHAVDRGIARYEQGTWVLPEKRPEQQVPTSSEDAFLFTMAMLSAEARDLAELLSGHRGNVPLSVCRALGSETGADRVYAALNELVERDVLVSDGDTYRFRQGALRESVLQRLSRERQMEVHRRLGEALLSTGKSDPKNQVEAGWHLLRGGSELRGAELLAGIVDKTRTLGRLEMDLQAAIPALEASLTVLREQGRPVLDRVPLLIALVEGGYYVDRAMAKRYGLEAIEQLSKVTGIELAERLRPRLGRLASLAVGISVARIRFAFQSRDRSNRAFEELFTALLTSTTYLCGISTLCLDPVGARRFVAVLEPLSALGRSQAPAGVYEYCVCLANIVQDRFADAATGMEDLIDRLSRPGALKRLPDESRRLLLGGAWYARGVLESFRDGESVLQCAAQLDKLGLRFYEMIADRLRVSYHLYRGETEGAQRYRSKLELYACQTGSTWQVELWGAATSITAYYRVHDALRVKQCAERLYSLGKDIPTLRLHARVAEGIYHLLRDDPERAIELIADNPEYSQPREHVGWAPVQGQLAQAYNAAGRHEEARKTCVAALAHLSKQDRDFIVMTLDIEIQLALAECGLGQTAEAARRLDGLIERFADRGPVSRARLYEARARVAAAEGDRATLAGYLERMEKAARATHNPALIAQWRRVARQTTSPAVARASVAAKLVKLDRFQPWATTFADIRLALPGRLRDLEEEFTATESHIDH